MSEITRKGVNVLTADIKATKEGAGYSITLSMPTQDRDGEIVDAKAFDPLPPGRLPIDVDHGMTTLTTVGSGIPVYEGDRLVLRDFRFASTTLGGEVKILVDEGHVSKMSVAFMDAKREMKGGVPHVVKAELLNAAIVAIPSNRESDIALAAKSFGRRVEVRRVLEEAEQYLIELALEDAKAIGDDRFRGGRGSASEFVNNTLRSI